MNPWYAKTLVLVASVVMVVIRAPHGHRSRGVKVVKSRKGPLEKALLTLAWLAFFLPVLWVATPALAFADYPLRPIPLIAGILCLALGLWIFHRSHADLGTNWSIKALALPNRVAGPSYLVAMAVLFALRVGPEERMMREEFGADYDTYRARTRRLLPGVW